MTKMHNEAEDQNLTVEIPEIIPVLPLRDLVIFPYMISPVLVGRDLSINAANFSLNNHRLIFLSAQKNSNIDEPGPDELYREGTIAKIVQTMKLPNGLLKIVVDGLVMGKIKNFTGETEYFEAQIQLREVQSSNDAEITALIRQAEIAFKEYASLNKNINAETLVSFENISEPDRKLYFAAANINQAIEGKMKIMRKSRLKDQYYELIKLLRGEIEILKVEKEIDHKVQENIARTQRKFIIQEQIKILQEELGEDDALSEEAKLLEEIESAGMPEAVEDKAIEEYNKLSKIPPMSPEYTVIRNYLDWLIAVPWKKQTKDKLDISHVQKILDEDHFGLEKPKERIIEHIAVLNLVKNMRGQILCLVGPPGVGKTSLGRSIARALGRQFVRISLGGVRDEAEIRGHRKTYIGSMPGKIVQAMKRAGTINPVILLDEIDKLSSDFRGDPSSAMLEVLDPEQNFSFNDHYLEVDYDLSQVLFITTANVRYNIPLPLQDRMEIIELSSYLEVDKIEIAKRHIIPKQVKLHGLSKSRVKFEDEAILEIIGNYTRESGVRSMEREITAVLRKVAKDVVSRIQAKEKGSKKQVVVTPQLVEKYLGAPRYKKHIYEKGARIGSVTGLAWTSVGGDILKVDVTVMHGKEKLTLTGQLGNVMKESAQAGLSYIRSNAHKFALKPDFMLNKEIHIHLPEGAIPKDGPSAGITMIMAMLSAFLELPASDSVAMTGEITLRGEVLPIGGLNEKLLAARRNGYKTVLIPNDNTADVAEIRDTITKDLTIVPVETVEEALDWVFPGWKEAVALRKAKADEEPAEPRKKRRTPLQDLN
ncbi:MAG: Lon protease [Chlorobiota bacterium]